MQNYKKDSLSVLESKREKKVKKRENKYLGANKKGCRWPKTSAMPKGWTQKTHCILWWITDSHRKEWFRAYQSLAVKSTRSKPFASVGSPALICHNSFLNTESLPLRLSCSSWIKKESQLSPHESGPQNPWVIFVFIFSFVICLPLGMGSMKFSVCKRI